MESFSLEFGMAFSFEMEFRFWKWKKLNTENFNFF